LRVSSSTQPEQRDAFATTQRFLGCAVAFVAQVPNAAIICLGRAMRTVVRPPTAFGLVLFGTATLFGCTSTPSIQRETASVPLSEIVERVKCEIWLATTDELLDPHFAFLKNWDATVDLTMIINDQSGLNSGVSIVDPLKSITLLNKGTFGQSFTLGLGGGVTGQAILTDTASFSLALKELNSAEKGLSNEEVRAAHYHGCKALQDADLIGNLHLKEWVRETLVPVYDSKTNYQLLTRGAHPSVKGIKPAAKETVKALTDLKTERSSPATSKVPDQSDGLKPESKASTTTIQSAIDAIDPDQHTESEIRDSFERFMTQTRRNDPHALEDTKFAQPLNKFAAKLTKTPPKKPKLNDPLDTISHQVQFIVAWTGNITPAWSLFNIRGPNPASGAFITGQHITTHQLAITMGPTGTSQKLSNADVQAARTAQQFNGALQRLQIAPIQ
jgi:hypothetical protein